MTAKRMFALFLGLLLLVCPLLVACDDSDKGAEDTSSANGTTSNGGSANGNNSEEDSKYLDSNGKYTLDNLDMPEFNFNSDTFTVCVYNNVVQVTYYSEEVEALASSDTVLQKGVSDRNDLIEEKYGVTV